MKTKRKRWKFLTSQPRDLKSFDMKYAFEQSKPFKSRDNQKIDLKSSGLRKKITLSNDIMMHDDSEIRKRIEKIMNKWKKLWKKKSFIVRIFKSTFMFISLKSNWAKKIKTNRVYSLDFKNRVLVNEIFDKLHQEKKMQWSKNFTSFEYSVFVMWKIVFKNGTSIRKNRVVIDIREFNDIIQIDAYPMPTQTKIIISVIECSHIFIMNAQKYFYQWIGKKKIAINRQLLLIEIKKNSM